MSANGRLLLGLGLGLSLGILISRRRRKHASDSSARANPTSDANIALPFAGRKVVITGGANGIGLGVVRAFHKAGAMVICADIDVESGEQLTNELGSSRFQFLQCDASDGASIRAFCDKVCLSTDSVDCLVNNVGVQFDDGHAVHELSEDVFDRVMSINLKSYFLFSKYLIPGMLKRGRGVIINMASVQGLQSQRGIPAYAASKGAVLSMTRQMSIDYARKGIRVVAVNPGTIRTPLVEKLLRGRHGQDYLSEALRKAGAAYPMGRIGEIAEVAKVVLFLAGDGASFITGESVTVDGGIMSVGGWAETA